MRESSLCSERSYHDHEEYASHDNNYDTCKFDDDQQGLTTRLSANAKQVDDVHMTPNLLHYLHFLMKCDVMMLLVMMMMRVMVMMTTMMFT